MAYAEKRGRYWRGRYRHPPAVRPLWGTVSADEEGWPFTEKQRALEAANDKEAELRRLMAQWDGPDPAPGSMTIDQWKQAWAGQRRARGERDPYAGAVQFRDWVEKVWLPAQDLEDSSETVYRQHLRLRIYPTWGERPLNTMTSHEEFNLWDRRLRRRYADNTVSNTRNLLTTILGDVCAAGILDINACARRRRRGKVAERRQQQMRTPRSWITPLQTLLIAERAAALTGNDADFVMWITCGWTGTRWGELMGLQRRAFLEDRLKVEVQLAPPDGSRFRCRPPKDGSFRNEQPGFFGAVDLPPFLSALLVRHMADQPPADCRCEPACGGTGFLFLSPDGTHHLHRSYSTFPWRPACDGRVDVRAGAAPRPVLVDLAVGWPGTALRPAWPVATGQDWSPPRARGQVRHDLPHVDGLAVQCPSCAAAPGQQCHSSGGRPGHMHRTRLTAAGAAGHLRHRVLASWLPIKRNLTPHELRHSQRVWMDEDLLPEVLKRDRLGHAMPGIGGTYSHVSPAMREQVKAAMQERWESALDQRLAISPTSSVPLLNVLLTARSTALRNRTPHDHLPNVSQTHENPSPSGSHRTLAGGRALPRARKKGQVRG